MQQVHQINAKFRMVEQVERVVVVHQVMRLEEDLYQNSSKHHLIRLKK